MKKIIFLFAIAVVVMVEQSAIGYQLQLDDFIPGIEERPGTHSVKDLALSPDEERLYAAHWQSGTVQVDDPIGVYDTGDYSLIEKLGVGGCVGGVIVSGDGRYVFGTKYYGGIVSRFDTLNANYKTSIDLGSWANMLWKTPDNSRAIVSYNAWSGIPSANHYLALVDISGDNFSVLDILDLGGPGGDKSVAFSPDGSLMYFVADSSTTEGARLLEISLVDDSLVINRKIVLAGGADDSNQMAGVVLVGDTLYVGDHDGMKIHVVDRLSLEKIDEDEINLPFTPNNIAMNPDGRHLFVLYGYECGRISVLDIQTKEQVCLIDCTQGLRKTPFYITFTSDGSKAYVSHADSDEGGVTVLLIDSEPSTTTTINVSSDMIFLNSGELNGQPLDPNDPQITVSPGGSITGTINITVRNHHDISALVPVCVTPKWGERKTSHRSIKNWAPVGDSNYDVYFNDDIAISAPSEIGMYYILFGSSDVLGASNPEMGYCAHVMSNTEWGDQDPAWGDGNDFFDFDESTIQFAIQNKWAQLEGSEPVGANAIKVHVVEPDKIWANFSYDSIIKNKIDLNDECETFYYNGFHGEILRGWKMVPSTSESTYFEGTFTTPTESINSTLEVTHLSSAADSCQGGGYSPVKITINDVLIEDCYDVAENHEGSRDYEVDIWEIGHRLRTDGTENTIRWELCSDACSEYLIRQFRIDIIDHSASTTTTSIPPTGETYKFERMWPTLKQPWYFSEPYDIAIDATSNVYIADTDNHRIMKFTADGHFLGDWGRYGSMENEFKNPHGIAVDTDGNIYVADTDNHRIQKCTPDGDCIVLCKNSGAGGCEFNRPHGIAVDTDGNIYVADTYNHRIQKCTPDGDCTILCGNNGAGNCDFDRPFGIAVSEEGEEVSIYVADTYNNRIQKCTIDGSCTTWGNVNEDPGIFIRPQGVAIGRDGNVYVSSSEEGVWKCTPDGNCTDLYSGKGFKGVDTDTSGFIYIADSFHSSILKVNTSNGNLLSQWGGQGSDEKKFALPKGVAISNDDIYVVDSKNNRIQKRNLCDSNDSNWETTEILGSNLELNGPEGIAVDGNGDIYVTDKKSHTIKKITSSGNNEVWGEMGTSEGQFFYPSGIAISNGYVYVADTFNHRIQKCTQDGDTVNCTSWGSWGTGDGRFDYPTGIAISDGYVYVADTFNHRIQKFTIDGEFEDSWGSYGYSAGQFFRPEGIAIDSDGYIYVADYGNNRIQKFTPDGTLTPDDIFIYGGRGHGPFQFNRPSYLVFDSKDTIYISDTYNNRIQVFNESTTNNKAIIVAGRASPGDGLWDATRFCTNFAYWTLLNQGFTRDDIYYLTADTDVDIDGNRVFNEVTGYSDDVDDVPNENTLRNVIIQWAAGADNLLLYLNDHGGHEQFIMHGGSDGILEADTLAKWLNLFSGKVTLIYEACESGSFMNKLEGPDRIIITSTAPEEQAKFLGTGTVSFSNFFWTDIFNGHSIFDSYNNAKEIVNDAFPNQNPQLSGEEASNTYIGNGEPDMIGDSPIIGRVSAPQEIIGEETSATIYADEISDPNEDTIKRVWAVIWSPNFNSGSVDTPLLDVDVPTLELLYNDQNSRYEGTYSEFTEDGTYQIIISAMDSYNNTSLPHLTTVSRNVNKRAIIVAGGSSSSVTGKMIKENAEIAYNAFVEQEYTEDEIHLMGLSDDITDFDTEPNSNLESVINSFDDIENLDLIVYLIGEGDTETFVLNDQVEPDILNASQLDIWLDNLPTESKITVVYDADKSGSFIPLLTPPPGTKRIIVTSSGEEGSAYFGDHGNVCFSYYFFSQVAMGMNIYEALAITKDALSHLRREEDISFSCYKPNSPLIDANGNGIANEAEDFELAKSHTIGVGMKFADDPPPEIGSVFMEEAENSAIISAEVIPRLHPIEKVWAIIKPINFCPNTSEEQSHDFTEIELLDPDGDLRYENSYSYSDPCFKVFVYAMDENGNTSLPIETKIYQTEGADIYENPDNDALSDDYRPEANVIVVGDEIPQPHNFHYPADVDWIKFYGLSGEHYTIKTKNLGSDAEPIIELYYEDELKPKKDKFGPEHLVDKSVLLEFECEEGGIYYVHLSNGKHLEEGGYEAYDTKYDLEVYHPILPPVALVTGRIVELFSNDPINGALILTNGAGATISVGGRYYLFHILGSNWSMFAVKQGYFPYFGLFSLDAASLLRIKHIVMIPIEPLPECRTNTDCDDGLFCNGSEMCAGETCSPGINPPCSDDGEFCNGVESCDEENDSCLSSGNPCATNLTCDEDNDMCVGCIQDAHCDDGLFCNGVETCVDGVCKPGTDRCPDDGEFCNGVESCDEGGDQCVSSGDPCPPPDEPEKIICKEENDICVPPGPVVIDITINPNSSFCSHLMPLPLIMFIEGEESNFNQTTTVNFEGDAIWPPMHIVLSPSNIFIFSIIKPAGLEASGSVEVLVEVTSTVDNGVDEPYDEDGSSPLTLNMLPWILEE